mgnify:CR=1 FL=1
MKYIKKIISFCIYFLIKLKFLKLPNKSLRVLMFHDVSDLKNFINQITILRKSWNFITPKQFYDICLGKKKIKNRLLLLTFDDGFESNFYVAQNILKKFNIKAIFFLPLKFLLIKKKSLKINFIKHNLKIKSPHKKMNNMNLDQINKIIRLKHSIGAHTYSHIDLKNVKNNKKIKYEIVDSANELQKILKIKINDFSFNFGRLRDISSRMLSLSKKRFDFIYTGIRGDNSDIDKIIFRDNVLPSDNKYDLFTYLSGQLDFLYSNERKTLRSKFKKK